MNVNSCPSIKSWRMVYDGDTVLHLFESEGVTETINQLFVSSPTEGTGSVTSEVGKQECLEFAKAHGLTVPDKLLPEAHAAPKRK